MHPRARALSLPVSRDHPRLPPAPLRLRSCACPAALAAAALVMFWKSETRLSYVPNTPSSLLCGQRFGRGRVAQPWASERHLPR